MRLLSLLIPWLIGAAALPAQAAALHRVAVVAGTNDGGSSRPRLRFAASDARAFAGVLQELGGVDPADTIVLEEADRAAFDRGLSLAAQRLTAARAPGVRLELIVYYSGHSDENGLLLRGDLYPYGELRRALGELPADVRIAVLDSCSSGALTRGKGGVRRAPFAIDEASRVRGHAFLTSSSQDEAAQESDRVGGSFFTHFLVSGLRGAADVSSDGKVTLTEAYQFAYHETLARTERTRAGPQHAAYDIQLVGTGDLVLTDLRSTSAGLALEKAVDGRVFVRDGRDRLVVELRKMPGRDVEVGLAPGRYRVTVDAEGTVSEATVDVRPGSRTPLSSAQLRPVSREAVAVRGGEPELALENPHVAVWPVERDAARRSRFSLQLPAGQLGKLEGISFGFVGLRVLGDVQGGQFSIAGGTAGGDVRGVQASVGGNVAGGNVEGLQSAVGITIAGGEVKGLQAAVGFASAGGKVEGAQTAVGVAWTEGPLQGIQASVGLSRARGDSRGLQTSVGAAIHEEGELDGLQAAVGVAHADRIDGLQASVGLASAGEVEGLQTALIDVAGKIDGLQLGLINVAGESRGLQLGLINVADSADATIGLLNLVRDGRIDMDVYATELRPLNLELRTGTKGMYGLLLAGVDPRIDRSTPWHYGLGIGGRFKASIVDLDLGFAASHLLRSGRIEDTANVMATARFTAGLRVLPGFSVFAGPTYNVLVQWEGQTADPGPAFQQVDRPDEEVAIRRWPGLMAGIRLTPHGF